MIPNEAVEAAAAIVADKVAYGWVNDEHREIAREILEGAAPHLMAEAWDRAAASIVDEHGNPVIPTNVDNPYREIVQTPLDY